MRSNYNQLNPALNRFLPQYGQPTAFQNVLKPLEFMNRGSVNQNSNNLLDNKNVMNSNLNNNQNNNLDNKNSIAATTKSSTQQPYRPRGNNDSRFEGPTNQKKTSTNTLDEHLLSNDLAFLGVAKQQTVGKVDKVAPSGPVVDNNDNDWNLRRSKDLQKNWDAKLRNSRNFDLVHSYDRDQVDQKLNDFFIAGNEPETPSTVAPLSPTSKQSLVDDFWEQQFDWSAPQSPKIFNAGVSSFELEPLDWSGKYPPAAFLVETSWDAAGNLQWDPIFQWNYDWSAGGVPLEIDFWSDPILNWSESGVPQVFQTSRWANVAQSKEISMDWSAAGVPHMFACRKRNQSLRVPDAELLVINWGKSGSLLRIKPKLSSFWNVDIQYDWSQPGVSFAQFPQQRFKQDKYDPLVNDWSGSGIPQQILQAGWKSLFNSDILVLDWSGKGVPRAFKTASRESASLRRRQRERQDVALIQGAADWTVAGMPFQFSMGGDIVAEQGPAIIDWSRDGRPEEFKNSVWEPELSLDWGSGMPHLFDVGSKRDYGCSVTCREVDWSASGAPWQFRKLENDYEEEKPGVFLSVDWSGSGAPISMKENPYECQLDWGCEGLPKRLTDALDFGAHSAKWIRKMLMFTGETNRKCAAEARQRRREAKVQQKLLRHSSSLESTNSSSAAEQWVICDELGVVHRNLKNRPNNNAVIIDRHGVVHEDLVNYQESWGKNKSEVLVIDSSGHIFEEDDYVNGWNFPSLETPKAPQYESPTNDFVLLKNANKELAQARQFEESLFDQSYRRTAFWERQLDWCAAGVPEIFGQGKTRALSREKFQRNRNIEEHGTVSLGRQRNSKRLRGLNAKRNQQKEEAKKFGAIDWGGAGVPTEQLQRSDALAIDWSESRLPRELWEPARHAYQLVLDWSADGIPMQIRNVWGGKRAALETPVMDWSQEGIPKMLRNVARDTGRNRQRLMTFSRDEDGGVTVDPAQAFKFSEGIAEEAEGLDWTCQGLPAQLVGSPFWDDFSLDWSAGGMPSLFRSVWKRWRSPHQPRDAEVVWCDWSKPGVATRKWFAKDRAYSLDWSAAGIPTEIALAPVYEANAKNRKKNRSSGGEKSEVLPVLECSTTTSRSSRRSPSASTSRSSNNHFRTATPHSPFYHVSVPDSFNLLNFDVHKDSKDGSWHNLVDSHKVIERSPSLTLQDASTRYSMLRGRDFAMDWGVEGLPEQLRQRMGPLMPSNKPDAEGEKPIALDRKFSLYWDKAQESPPFYEQTLDWTCVGVPHQLKMGKFLPEEVPVDWSAKGLPAKEFWLEDRQFDWSATGLPPEINLNKRVFAEIVCDWSIAGIPYAVRKIANQAAELFQSVDWGVKGLPVKFGFWDEPVFNWHYRGVPGRGGSIPRQSKRVLVIDWSVDLMPKIFVDTCIFEDNLLRNNVRPEDRKLRGANKLQESWVVRDDDVRNLGQLRNNPKKKNSVDSPWNRGKDNRREARFEYRMKHTKVTRRALRMVLQEEARTAKLLQRKKVTRRRANLKKRLLMEKDIYLGRLQHGKEPVDEPPWHKEGSWRVVDVDWVFL